MEKKKRYLGLALVFALATLVLSPTVLANQDVEVSVDISGAVTIVGNGDYSGAGSLDFEDITVSADADSSTSWTATTSDYITVADTTGTPGFHVLVQMNEWTYTGDATASTDLLGADDMMLRGQDGAVPDAGSNDPTKNVNVITANSCPQATPAQFSFNEAFSSATDNYAMRLSSAAEQKLIEATNPCAVKANVSFDEIELEIPQFLAAGSYQNTLTFTIVDGQF